MGYTKHTISFLSHHLSIVNYCSFGYISSQSSFASFNLFQSTQSFFNLSHLRLYFTLGYSFLVFFSKAVIIFVQPFLLKWGLGQLPLNTLSTQASQKIVVTLDGHWTLTFELFWDCLVLGFEVSLFLTI